MRVFNSPCYVWLYLFSIAYGLAIMECRLHSFKTGGTSHQDTNAKLLKRNKVLKADKI